ncbi:MAG: ATP-dependent RNA helicase, partial [Thermoanaerobaculia bacterium]
GKTTRVPPALAALEGARGQVVVLEPRRVAARAAARRIAAEQGWTLGREVGWWIRFERRFRPDSRVVFATEGVLLRWLQRDPFLEGVGTLIFDEFHERTLAADLALALARRVRREVRPDLRLVVMSATLELEPLAAFLDGAAAVRSAGRLHPVTGELLARPGDRPLALQVTSAVSRALGRTDGDLLVFLPGLVEIRRCEEALAPLAAERGLDLRPLHGDLPIDSQDAALRRGPRRRIVLATNVAETSVTVEGVRGVIDSGLVRQLRYDPATGLDRLETIRISRASAEQRAGRAGREAPGFCLRLWHAGDDLALRPFDLPEVRRVDLAGAILELAAWGERDPASFDWFEAPEPARLARAVSTLRDLGALDDHGVTPLGRRMVALPLAPRLARLVLEGERLGVEEGAALVAALLAEHDPFAAEARREGRAGTQSDLLDRLDALDRRRHRRIFDAAGQILARLGEESVTQQETKRFVQDQDRDRGAFGAGGAGEASVGVGASVDSKTKTSMKG